MRSGQLATVCGAVDTMTNMPPGKAHESLVDTVARPGRSSFAWTEPLTLAGFCAYLFFFGLGSFGLVGADEPRYAQIAREMLARHDWVTPTLTGTPWLEKPALYYWSAMVSYKIFGVSDWAARVPSAVFATAMVGAVYLFMKRFRGMALDAALIAASFAGTIGFARGASTDMPLTATLTMAMLAWYAWYRTSAKFWLIAFYVMAASGTLAKGPVAPALIGVIIMIFALIKPGNTNEEGLVTVGATRWRLIVKTLWVPGMLLFLGITLPWYIAVQRATGNFFQVFILQHNLERFGTNLYRHKQPYWYYGHVFLMSVVPWAVYVLAAIFSPESRVPSPESRETAKLHNFRVFLLIWIAVPLIIFTISQSKLPGYILPSVPPCALLLADWLRTRREEQTSVWLRLMHSIVCGLLLAAALVAPSFMVRATPPRLAIVIGSVTAFGMFVAVLQTLRSQGLRWLRFVTLVPVVLGLALVLRIASPVIDRTQSARPVVNALSQLDSRGAQVAAFNITRETEYGLDFYRNQPVERYERGEVPAADHLLIARTGSEAQLASFLKGRRLSHVGSFPSQNLEFFWVSSPPAGHHHE